MKNFKRIFTVLIISSTLITSCYMPRNGFYENSRGIKYYENDVFLTGWQVIDGKKRYFTYEGGYMITKSCELGGYWFGFMPDGSLAEGFLKDDDGVRYYINGRYQTGWQTIDGFTYYFYKENGIMATGNVTVLGKEYSFDKDGRLTTPEETENE